MLTVIISAILALTMYVPAFDGNEVGYDVLNVEEILENTIYGSSKDVDISNNELDTFIENINDAERVSLIKDYMLLPSIEESRIKELENLEVIEKAEYLSKMPIEELREASERVRKDVDHAIEVQNQKNDVEYQNLMKNINASRIAAGTYSDTLKCSLSGESGDIAMLKCYVKWKINSSGNVTSLIPDTVTELYDNDYEWTNSLQGTQYTKSGKGYVEKYRSFKYYSTSSSGKHTLHVKGTFGASSKALSRYERVK